MNYLSVERLSKSFHEQAILSDLTFGLSKGQKVGLVGSNGCGKSTLLRILAGMEKADSGHVVFRKGLKIRYLDQNPEFGTASTIRDWFFSEEDGLLSTILQYEQLIAGIADDPQGDLLQGLINKIDAIQGWDFEAQVKQILGKLNIHDLDGPVDALSGGEKKRVALAKVLLERPDFLMLDEPTNHLDIAVIEWLENYLSTQNLTLVLVTHDRYFLEKVTDEILELDRGKVFYYHGNYGYFLQKKAERAEVQSSEVLKARNLLVKELDWLNRMPKARGSKAKYRIDAIQQLQEKAAGNTKKQHLRLSISMPRQGKKILELQDIHKSYGNSTCLGGFSYTFKKGDKVGVVGNNGSGKTTLLNIITGSVMPDKGKVIRGENTSFGYYRQDEITFSEGQKVIDLVTEVAEVIQLDDGSTISASQFLQHFMFPPPSHYVLVEKLSGGEKRRLQLLRTLLQKPNFLILDEPTNDLDIYTLNVLEEYLMDFSGIVMVVTHDRYFLDKITNHTFALDGKGHVSDFPGTYSQLREVSPEVPESQHIGKKAAKSGKAPMRPSLKSEKKITYKEKRELEQLESEIETMEKERDALVELIQRGTDDHRQMAGWSEDYEKITLLIDQKMERWLELSALAEKS